MKLSTCQLEASTKIELALVNKVTSSSRAFYCMLSTLIEPNFGTGAELIETLYWGTKISSVLRHGGSFASNLAASSDSMEFVFELLY